MISATASKNGNGQRSPVEPLTNPTGFPLSMESFRAEAEKYFAEKAARPMPHTDVLGEILGILSPIDFQAESGLEAGARLNQKQLRVVSVQEILAKAREIDCGLAKSIDFVYVFNGCYWRLVDKSDLQEFLGKAAE